MEASALRAPALRGEYAPKPSAGSRFADGFLTPLRGVVNEAAEIGTFTGRTLMELRGVWRYSSEILRQCGILIAGSAAIIVFMLFVMGVECGLEANYVLRGYGATVYSGVFTSYCAVREMIPYMWGYILAAKVGCGLVAEIGSMRISDEIDAIEVMGIDSHVYLVGTRVVAAWMSMPFLYAVSLAMMSLGEILVAVYLVGGVSPGGHNYIFWLYQNPLDYFFSMCKAMAMGTTIVFVACYYGYTVRGGSVEVGKNTAKSMILNMILIHVIGALGTQLFWGSTPNAPIGN